MSLYIIMSMAEITAISRTTQYGIHNMYKYAHNLIAYLVTEISQVSFRFYRSDTLMGTLCKRVKNKDPVKWIIVRAKSSFSCTIHY